MHSPKMILFDYGHTLLYEPDWDPVRGTATLLQFAVSKRPEYYDKNERHPTGPCGSLPHLYPARCLALCPAFEFCGRFLHSTPLSNCISGMTSRMEALMR